MKSKKTPAATSAGRTPPPMLDIPPSFAADPLPESPEERRELHPLIPLLCLLAVLGTCLVFTALRG
jgi:hypothetical protein